MQSGPCTSCSLKLSHSSVTFLGSRPNFQFLDRFFLILNPPWLVPALDHSSTSSWPGWLLASSSFRWQTRPLRGLSWPSSLFTYTQLFTLHPRFAIVQFSSAAQLCSTLRPHGLQHTRPPCPSAPPGVYPNSCPLSRWCHPTILSSVIPFSFCLQSFPVSGSFQMSQFFASGGQSIGVSASASVLPMNIQDWFPLGWTGWTSLQSKGLSRVFSNTTVQKHQFFGA